MTTDKKLDELTIRIPIEQKRKLAGLVAIKGGNVSDAVRNMIEQFINEHEREYESMKAIFGDGEAQHNE